MKNAPVLVPLIALLTLPLQAAPIPVSGRVVDSAGKPVANAKVELLSILSYPEDGRREITAKTDREPTATATTDAAGYFTVKAPDAGMWKVRVAAAGYVPLQLPLSPLLEEIELPDARLLADVRLQVRLTDQQGRPIAGGRIRVEDSRSSSTAEGPWRLRPRVAFTDESGTAVIPRLKEEALTVRAAAPGLPLVAVRTTGAGAFQIPARHGDAGRRGRGHAQISGAH